MRTNDADDGEDIAIDFNRMPNSMRAPADSLGDLFPNQAYFAFIFPIDDGQVAAFD